MSGLTSISWTDATWNPTRGCSRVSKGCEHCYAERIAARFSGPGLPHEGFAYVNDSGESSRRHHWTGRVEIVESALDWPLRWRGSEEAREEGRPSRIFVNSMSDLFHENLSDADIDRVFAVMALARQHTFQVLTKRAERMRQFVSENYVPIPNVWLGVSVEDQTTADERIPLLLQTPAAVRFVSYEPALGPVDFTRVDCGTGETKLEALMGARPAWAPLDWVIIGGESGPGARPMHPTWARSSILQCKAADVPVFLKQQGAWQPKLWRDDPTRDRRWGTLDRDGHWYLETTPWNGRQGDDSETDELVMIHVGGHGEDWNEWPEDMRVREFPTTDGCDHEWQRKRAR